MAKFAILRVEKLKDRAEVVRSLKHCFREQETPNADPGRLSANQHFEAASVKEAMAALEEKLPKKLRKNGVLVLEYMITASPEALAAMPQEAGNTYLKDALQWLRKRHGGDNIFVGTIHNDETTPHLSVFVVPKDARGRMNARFFTGGREALSVLQTNFAKDVGEKYGLIRGIEKSGARHVSIREYYRSIKQAEKQTATAEKTLETQQQLGRFKMMQGEISPEITDAVKTNAALVAEVKRLQRENEALKRQVAVQASTLAKERAAEVRELALGEVISALGGVPVRDRPGFWDTPVGLIETDNDRPRWFKIKEANVVGRGAIDLVKAVDEKTFDEAVSWLDKMVLQGKSPDILNRDTEKSLAEKAIIFVNEARASEQKPVETIKVDHDGNEVREAGHYLITEFGISEDLITGLIGDKNFGVTKLGGKSFVALSGQEEIVGPGRRWSLFEPETGKEYFRGQPDAFCFSFGKDDGTIGRSETAAIFTESPLDALAISTAFFKGLILPTFRGLVVVATKGISFDKLREFVREAGKAARALIPAFPRDDHGKTLRGHFTRALAEEKVQPDNKGYEPVPFPQGCTRWIDVLRRWQEVEELQEERRKKAERLRARPGRNRGGVERD